MQPTQLFIEVWSIFRNLIESNLIPLPTTLPLVIPSVTMDFLVNSLKAGSLAVLSRLFQSLTLLMFGVPEESLKVSCGLVNFDWSWIFVTSTLSGGISLILSGETLD